MFRLMFEKRIKRKSKGAAGDCCETREVSERIQVFSEKREVRGSVPKGNWIKESTNTYSHKDRKENERDRSTRDKRAISEERCSIFGKEGE